MGFVFFLPFLLFRNLPTAEDSFLSAIINYTNSSTVHFKLSPTYVLYMACRHVLSSQYRPDVSPAERTHKVIAIVNKMVSMMDGVIQVSAPCWRLGLRGGPSRGSRLGARVTLLKPKLGEAVEGCRTFKVERRKTSLFLSFGILRADRLGPRSLGGHEEDLSNYSSF